MIRSLPVITPAFQITNYMEAALWWIIAATALVRTRRLSSMARADGVMFAGDLFVFGVSDLVEAQTGAWWRPWWLLVWKTSCVLVLIVLAARYLSRRGGSGAP